MYQFWTIVYSCTQLHCYIDSTIGNLIIVWLKSTCEMAAGGTISVQRKPLMFQIQRSSLLLGWRKRVSLGGTVNCSACHRCCLTGWVFAAFFFNFVSPVPAGFILIFIFSFQSYWMEWWQTAGVFFNLRLGQIFGNLLSWRQLIYNILHKMGNTLLGILIYPNIRNRSRNKYAIQLFTPALPSIRV